MEKINRYKPTQNHSFEEFFNLVTDIGICECCQSYEECKELMGEDNIKSISGNGCSAFDNSIDNIKKIYLLKECTIKPE